MAEGFTDGEAREVTQGLKEVGLFGRAVDTAGHALKEGQALGDRCVRLGIVFVQATNHVVVGTVAARVVLERGTGRQGPVGRSRTSPILHGTHGRRRHRQQLWQLVRRVLSKVTVKGVETTDGGVVGERVGAVGVVDDGRRDARGTREVEVQRFPAKGDGVAKVIVCVQQNRRVLVGETTAHAGAVDDGQRAAIALKATKAHRVVRVREEGARQKVRQSIRRRAVDNADVDTGIGRSNEEVSRRLKGEDDGRAVVVAGLARREHLVQRRRTHPIGRCSNHVIRLRQHNVVTRHITDFR